MLLATDGPFPGWDWDIVWDADMNEPLPQFLGADELPLNLTGLSIEVYVRPSYDHTLLQKKFSGAEIIYDDRPNGLVTVQCPRATVQAAIPVGEWDFFVLLTDGTAFAELARGPFKMHPGKTTG